MVNRRTQNQETGVWGRAVLQRKTSKLREGDTISNLVDPFLSEAVQSEWKIHAKEESRAGEKELCKQLWTKY